LLQIEVFADSFLDFLTF